MPCNKKQLDMIASFRGTYKQTVHDILDYRPSYKHIDYSMGFTGESGGPDAVLKAFPALKEKIIWPEKAPFKDIED